MLKRKAGAGAVSQNQPEPQPARPAEMAGTSHAQAAFLATLEPVLAADGQRYAFAGAIERGHARTIWSWIERDVAPDAAVRLGEAIHAGQQPLSAFDAAADHILDMLRGQLGAERDNPELAHRNTARLGGPDARLRLPYVVMALRRRAQLVQALHFGRTLGHIRDEASLAQALDTITISNPITRALWMQAMVSAMPNPGRVMGAAVRRAGGGNEAALSDAGFAPLVDTMLSHAQGQLAALTTQPGIFTDYDLACRAIDRFHRLMRALSAHCAFGYKSRWLAVASNLTALMSERLVAPLRQVPRSVTQALGRPAEGEDRLDPDKVLDGLNGLYLLATVRRSRDSLAVNALLDQVWSETGQILETLVPRTLDAYRLRPGDPVARARLDAAIRMAEIRFNGAFADTLRRARDGVERRHQLAALEPSARAS